MVMLIIQHVQLGIACTSLHFFVISLLFVDSLSLLFLFYALLLPALSWVNERHFSLHC